MNFIVTMYQNISGMIISKHQPIEKKHYVRVGLLLLGICLFKDN